MYSSVGLGLVVVSATYCLLFDENLYTHLYTILIPARSKETNLPKRNNAPPLPQATSTNLTSSKAVVDREDNDASNSPTNTSNGTTGSSAKKKKANASVGGR